MTILSRLSIDAKWQADCRAAADLSSDNRYDRDKEEEWMYVYTHAVVGAALGAQVKTNRSCAILGALGGVLPDIPMGVQIAWTLAHGMDPYNIKWSKPIVTVSDAFHSLPICALLLVIGWNKGGLRSFALAMTVHSAMDAVSHAITPEFKATYLWPLPWQLGKWVSVWDYRRSSKLSAPKWPEIAVDALALAFLGFKLRRKKRQAGQSARR